MGYFSQRERREADLFYADLMGFSTPRRRRARRPATIEATFAGETIEPPIDDTSINPARVFDAVVAGADPTPLLADGDDGAVWEPVALPSSPTPRSALRPGALVVTRALGEGHLAFLEVLGEDVEIESLYGEGNCIRPDVLVLDRRSAGRSIEPAESEDTSESIEPAQAEDTIERWIAPRDEALDEGDAVELWQGTEGVADPGVIEIMQSLEDTEPSEIAAGLDFLERIESPDAEAPAPAPAPTRTPAPAPAPAPPSALRLSLAPAAGVTIEAATGLGTSRTVAPIATISPHRQMNEVLDRELILFAKARILAEWVNRNFSATFEQAFNDTALRARLDVSKDRALLDRLRPFPQQKIPARRDQLFTTDAVLKPLLKAPTDVAGLWPIFDVLHHYGVVLLPPDPKNPFGRPSVLASITRVDARLDRARFDTGTAAVEQHAIKFKKAVGNASILHHAVEPEAIPADWWAGGKKSTPLQVAKPVVALLRRLRDLNQTWRAGTYAGHWWNDFSVDIFIAADLEPSKFWNRGRVRDFFRALNTACEQDTAPGRFAWKGIYNDAGAATELDGLYGAGRVLSGVDGHGPGPKMHFHLDLRPLTVPFDATTGFWLDGARVVLSPPSARPAVPGPTPQPVPVRTREDVAHETDDRAEDWEGEDWEDVERETDAPESSDEAVPSGGRGRFRHAPLGGKGDNVEARWNVDASTASGSTVDVVVYLHGYGAPATDFLSAKAKSAGIDLVDSTGAVRVRTARPTLALVPRGRNSSGSVWVFDALPDAAAFNALVDAGVSWLASSVLKLAGGSTLTRGRLTLMAHSGGGAALSVLLASGLNPDEVVCFDSLYGGEVPVARWAEARIASPAAAHSGLRAFYTPCDPSSWNYWKTDKKWHLISTEVAARRLQHAVDRAISSSGNTALANRFRVERTSVGHSAIPGRYSPLLLDDIAATVPDATKAPPSTSRPPCVANDDWLTNAPRKPGGEDPPAPKSGQKESA